MISEVLEHLQRRAIAYSNQWKKTFSTQIKGAIAQSGSTLLNFYSGMGDSPSGKATINGVISQICGGGFTGRNGCDNTTTVQDKGQNRTGAEKKNWRHRTVPVARP